MSVFNNGGGDLHSNNLPSAFLEIAILLKNAEVQANGAAFSTLSTGLITIDCQFGISRVLIKAMIPVTQVITNTGVITTSGVSYAGYPYNQFTPGTGGDIVSTTKADALLAIAELVFIAERQGTSETSWYTSTNIDSNLISNVSTKLPIKKSTNSSTGATLIQVVDYLP